MSDHPSVPFESLAVADLIVDATFSGGTQGHRGDDPLYPLLGVGNAGGWFRVKGSVVGKTVRYGVLYTSGADPDWPDVLDLQTGTFTYHGDQKTPGKELHDTPRHGNAFLRDIFKWASDGEGGRQRIPPLFLFCKASERGTDVIFQGLLVPGAPGFRRDEELVAAWRSRKGKRYQNYRAVFTVLDVGVVPRLWLDDLRQGVTESRYEPLEWSKWVRTGTCEPLSAARPLTYRAKNEQMPTPEADTAMLATLVRHFAANPTAFEPCAARLWQMMAPGVEITEITRASVDGGRDAIGRLSLGPVEDTIKLSYSLEAKCYSPTTSVGARDIARLVSRLRHREFGVLVTTSYLDRQGYQEVRADRHPVVIICGADIVRLLRARGFDTPGAVQSWLDAEFPSL